MASTSAISSITPNAWAGRPVEDPDEMGTLNGHLTFDEATDYLANAQKTIKYFDAWIRYAEAAVRDYDKPLSNSGEFVVPPAVCAPSAGKWSWWRENTLDDSSTPCLVKVGQRARILGTVSVITIA